MPDTFVSEKGVNMIYTIKMEVKTKNTSNICFSKVDSNTSTEAERIFLMTEKRKASQCGYKVKEYEHGFSYEDPFQVYDVLVLDVY